MPTCRSGAHVASCQASVSPTSAAHAVNALLAAPRTSRSASRPSKSSGSDGTRRSSNSSPAKRPNNWGRASQVAMRSGDACHSSSSNNRLRFSGRSTLLIIHPGSSSRRSGSPRVPSRTVRANVCQTASAASASVASPSSPLPVPPPLPTAMRMAARACTATACQSRSKSPRTARGQQQPARSASRGSMARQSSALDAAKRHSSRGLRSIESSLSQPLSCQRANCCTTSARSAGAACAMANSRSPCAASTRKGVAASCIGSKRNALRKARNHSASARRAERRPSWPSATVRLPPSLLPAPPKSSSAKAAPHASRSALAAACRRRASSSGSARSQKISSAGKAQSSRRTAQGRLPPPCGDAAAAGSGGAQVPSQRSAHVSARASWRHTAGRPPGPTWRDKSARSASRWGRWAGAGWWPANARAKRANVWAQNSCNNSSSQDG
mmetsp:Transcript_78734/g.217695  ORF Transcript_78734/g.217695 Transcript_78734/m.217695 type:complete len:441 (-) Transcript_78734:255-1577(-)